MTAKIAVFATQKAYFARASELAQRLHVTLILNPKPDNLAAYDYLLLVTPDHLAIQPIDKTTHTLAAAPFTVDFFTRKITYRRKAASLRKEALAQGMGLKQRDQPVIIDATAGLGLDSFILATLGFKIILLERSLLLFTLLQDGLARAKKNSELAPIIDNMQLIQTDALKWLETAPQTDIIYLDPMFPARQKSAAVKKEMLLLQNIIGEDPDAPALLSKALACATQRVVVKRPRLASFLGNRRPSFSKIGKSNRFDVYII